MWVLTTKRQKKTEKNSWGVAPADNMRVLPMIFFGSFFVVFVVKKHSISKINTLAISIIYTILK